MPEVSAGQYIDFLKTQEGFRSEPYMDNGQWAVGYGHKIAEGENFQNGIDEAEADKLLNKDIADHFGRARRHVGEEEFDGLSPTDKFKLLDFEYNGVLRKFPKFKQAVVDGDLQTQLQEYRRKGNGKYLGRNKPFKSLFYGDEGDEKEAQQRREEPLIQKEPDRPNDSPLTQMFKSDDFQGLAPDVQMERLLEESPDFKKIWDEDKEEAESVARDLIDRYKTPDPDVFSSMRNSAEGGWDQGVAIAQVAMSNLAMLIEEAGLENDYDESWMAAADLNFIDAERKIGSNWYDQVISIVASLPGGLAVPGIATMGVGAGLGLIPAAATVAPFVAPIIGFGMGGALAVAHEGPEAALKRGLQDAALGAIYPVTASLGRMARMGIETAAAYAVAEGDDFQTRMVQAVPLGIIAGAPRRRAPYSLMQKLGVKDRFAEQKVAVSEARIKQRQNVQTIAGMNQVVHYMGKDGSPKQIKSLADVQEAYTQMLSGEHPMSTRGQDRDAFQMERIAKRDIESNQDPRPIDRTERSVEDRKSANFRPGPWWSEARKFTTDTSNVETIIGKKFKRAGEILAPLAKVLKVPIHFDLSKAERSRGTRGQYYLPESGVKSERLSLDRRGNVQTGSHELGHRVAYAENGLRRYSDLKDKELQSDFRRLDAVATQYGVGPENVFGASGTTKKPTDRRFTGIMEVDGKATVSGVFELYRNGKLPDDLNWMPEVLGHSYDRDNLAEGWAEIFRVWTTNNKDFGGEINLKLTAPNAMEILDKWFDGLSRKEKKGIKKFQNEAHEHLALQGDVAFGLGMGVDVDPGAVLSGGMARFRQSITDDQAGFMNLEKQIYGNVLPDGVYETMRLLRGTSEAAARMSDLGRPIWKFEEYLNSDGRTSTRRFIDYEGKSLNEILTPVSHTAGKQNMALRYVTARQAKELANQALYKGKVIELDKVKDPIFKAKLKRGYTRENLWSDEQIESALRTGEKYPEFEQVFQELKDFAVGMADFGEVSGLYSGAQRNQWKRNEFVFSFFREMEERAKQGDIRTRMLTGETPFHTLTGSSRQMRTPLMNLLETHSRTFKLGMENIAKLKLVDTLSEARGGGRFGAVVHKIPKMKEFDMTDIREAAARELHKKNPNFSKSEIDDVISVEFPENADLEHLTMFIGNTKPHGPNVMTVFREGKPEYYEINDPMLMRSIQMMRRPQLMGVEKHWNDLRKFKQKWITRGPGFMLANLWRDSAMASIMSRTGNVHFGKAIGGMWSAARKDASFREFIANGGGGAGIRDDFQTIQRRMVRHARKTGFDPRRLIVTPSDALRALDDIGRTMETASRLGEYKAARKQGMSAQHAAYLGREVSTDFAMRGDNALMNFMSNTIPFFNAMVAGGDRLVRGIASDPTNKAASAIKMATVGMASMGLYAMNRQIGEYMALPQWDKDSYWHFYFPSWGDDGERRRNEDGMFKGQLAYNHYKAPKLWEVGLIGSLGERTLQSMWDSDDQDTIDLAFGAAHMITQNFGVNLEGQAWPVPIPVGMDTAVEAFSNTVLFTGNPIESVARTNQNEWLRRRSGASRIWGEYGRMVAESPVPDIIESPAMAENLLRGFFGEFVGISTVLADEVFFPEGPEKLTSRSVPGIGRFYEEYGKYNNQAKEFYGRKESISKLSASFNWMAGHPGEKETFKEWTQDKHKMEQIGLSDKFNQIASSISSLEKLRERIQLGEIRGTPAELAARMRELEVNKRVLMEAMNKVGQQVDDNQRKREQDGG